MLLSFLLFILVTDCKQYNTTFSLVYKRGSRYLFKGSMVPFFALVALCLWYLLSVGGRRGTRDRQNNSTIEIAVLHLKTFPIIVGNGVSFLIFRHSTMCGLTFFLSQHFSLDCHHELDWQQTPWHKLHSRHCCWTDLDSINNCGPAWYTQDANCAVTFFDICFFLN